MIDLSKKILDKFEDLEAKELYQYHNEALFLHWFNIKGGTRSFERWWNVTRFYFRYRHNARDNS
ncbi:MAG: hypothetical protein ACPH4N_04380 [Flavobacteriaceae bacterium]